ncbi:MAG: class I SAM-dependent methyltransferase, partial [Gammaproteobacteria bacterium]
MPRISLVEKAHRRIAERLGGYDVAVDATVGNGHDLLFLAECVGQEGRVYGFDVQQSALDAARERLDKTGSGTRVTLFLCGHESMYDRIPAADRGRIAAVMFNLGYLPGGDKTVTTRA